VLEDITTLSVDVAGLIDDLLADSTPSLVSQRPISLAYEEEQLSRGIPYMSAIGDDLGSHLDVYGN
jgi:hypothetical protein